MAEKKSIKIGRTNFLVNGDMGSWSLTRFVNSVTGLFMHGKNTIPVKLVNSTG